MWCETIDIVTLKRQICKIDVDEHADEIFLKVTLEVYGPLKFKLRQMIALLIVQFSLKELYLGPKYRAYYRWANHETSILIWCQKKHMLITSSGMDG